MNKLASKFKLVILPFFVFSILIYSIITLVYMVLLNFQCYTAIYYIDYLLFFFLWIPFVIFLSPKLNFLKNPSNFYTVVASIISPFCLYYFSLILLNFIFYATATVNKLDNISQIESVKPSVYYEIKNFHINSNHIRYNSYIDKNNFIQIYIVSPILKSDADTLTSKCYAWYALHQESPLISEKSNSGQQKEEFLTKCIDDIKKSEGNKSYLLQRTAFNFGFAAYFKNLDEFTDAVAFSKKYYATSPILLTPVFNSIETQRWESLKYFIYGLISFILYFFFIFSIPKLNEGKSKELLTTTIEKS